MPVDRNESGSAVRSSELRKRGLGKLPEKARRMLPTLLSGDFVPPGEKLLCIRGTSTTLWQRSVISGAPPREISQ